MHDVSSNDWFVGNESNKKTISLMKEAYGQLDD